MQSNTMQVETPRTMADVVASLMVEVSAGSAAATASHFVRPIVELARVSGGDAETNARESIYAVRFPAANRSGDEAWSAVGRLNLDTVGVERALLAGLCVLAIKQVRDADVQIGDPVLVLGSDPWSLLLLQWAKLQGASPLVFAARGSRTLADFASAIGIEATLTDPSPRDIAGAAKLTFSGAGFAVAFDAIATEQSMAQALSAVRDGGRYVLTGLAPSPFITLNAYPDLHRRDLEIVAPTHSLIDVEVERLFRFSLDAADQKKLRLDGLLDPALGWRVVAA